MDTYAIMRTGKRHPKVVFLPTASRDDQGYAKRFKQYIRKLGCEVEVIRLFHTLYTKEEIKKAIITCDILYIGAGNLRLLMDTLHVWDLCDSIREAYQKGVVCVGNSAGASCYFQYGYSDLKDDGTSFDYEEGLHLVEGAFCPHGNDEKRCGFYIQEDKVRVEKYACDDKNAYVIEDGIAFYIENI